MAENRAEPERNGGSAADLALLRAYEPVLAYTHGEYFLPTDVERYVTGCSLWREDPARPERPVELAPAGTLDLDKLLAVADQHTDQPLFLQYVQRPASQRLVRQWRKTHPTGIRRSGRLAAVGLIARGIDVGLRLSLLIRGVVPGGVMTAAAHQYVASGGAEASPYYGRVARDGGYVILQYWYFYAANDWRSTFGGVNDHEADWEMATVYLADLPTGPQPRWVAFSSHDYVGDDLRRRWDDPELTRAGDHPVVFAGAGSHSGAFVPGEYLVTVNPRFLGAFARSWKRFFNRLRPRSKESDGQLGFGIPFIDYARGDGVRVGPGADRSWHPVLIDDETPWVRDFRGLWGRDTRDWADGERAPAGPRYERDGTVRPSWADPLGWAGLHKVTPEPSGLEVGLRSRVAELDGAIAAADAEAAEMRQAARTRHAEVMSLHTEAHQSQTAAERLDEAMAAEEAASRHIRERTAMAEERAVHQRVLATGLPPEPPQAHLRHKAHPFDQAAHRDRGVFTQIWAAVSVPLLLLAVATVLLLPGDITKLPLLVGILAAFAVLEAIARRRLMTTTLSIAVLVVSAAVVLDVLTWLARNARMGFLITMALAAVLLLGANVRDFFRR